jgi:hypothetical protein
MQRRGVLWLLCSIASALVFSINIFTVIDVVQTTRQSRPMQAVVQLLGIGTSKVSGKKGGTLEYSAKLKFIAEDGKTYSLSEFPNRFFKSSNWNDLVQDIKELTSRATVNVHCSSGFDGCFVHADAGGNTKLWLLLSGLALLFFVWLLYASKKYVIERQA